MTTALVTGCSSGIGFATALRLAAGGMDVVATMRSPDRDGQRLLHAGSGLAGTLTVAELDVTSDASVRAAFDRAGPLDVLVNNAAVMVFGSVEETLIEEWQAILDTTLVGTVRCTRAALPGFRSRQGGCIVNIGSTAGAVALPGVSAYTAAKAALESFSEITAIEGHQFGIRVVHVHTGVTATPMGSKVAPPPPSSPYMGSMKNTFAWLGSKGPQASRPEHVAEAVAAAIADPTTPLRIEVGCGSSELLRARRSMSDSEWIAAAGGRTSSFFEEYQRATGVDLKSANHRDS